MKFLLGCAVWAYKGWIGEFYPPKSPAGELLHLYSQRLRTVEGNTTFYAIPSSETIAQWKSQMSPGFRLCPKLPRSLTHNGLQKTEAAIALEVRHPDWFESPHASHLNELLTQLGVGRVLLDSRPAYSHSNLYKTPLDVRKPRLPVQPVVTADFSFVRFISHPDQEVNQPFLEAWVKWVDQALKLGRQIYFFVHCPIEDYSPANARQFQQLLEENGVLIPPLPWNQIDHSPIQLTLF
ncbi:MAG: DUF72 domain-containing protein [Coleofasciculus sp. B1-GNL1-01]|uniref:DUF72 domain-containing protein n=1 Tax=Coleofasciculus sp. B1-GNL1-01 TaxID=3068484 RepID=UPI0032F656DA